MSSATINWNEATAREDGPGWEPFSAASVSPAPGVPEERITRHEGIWGGMATVAGSRIPVFMIADLEAEGVSVGDIRKRYPHLTSADIYAALSYAHAYRPVIAEEGAEYWRAVEKYRR